jgi:hypothetical protein
VALHLGEGELTFSFDVLEQSLLVLLVGSGLGTASAKGR